MTMPRKTQFDPFPPLDTPYGAPMGRHCDPPELLRRYGVYFHARAGQCQDGYDRGGAYWGLPNNVWAVWCWVRTPRSKNKTLLVTYVRARTRALAIKEVLK